MSRYVVYESHTFDDDKCEMPDMGDFENLRQSIDNLTRLCNSLVSQDTFDLVKESMEERLQNTGNCLKQVADDIKKQKDSLRKELSEGDWKQLLRKDLEEVLRKLEQRYTSINNELEKRIEELRPATQMECRVNEKIANLPQTINKLIVDSCKDMREEKQEVLNKVEEFKQFLTTKWEEMTALSAKLEETRGKYEQAAERLTNYEDEILALQERIRKQEGTFATHCLRWGLLLLAILACCYLSRFIP